MTQTTHLQPLVIDKLDVDSLSVGSHHFWFTVAQNALGQAQSIPVIVHKASDEGPRIMVSAGVHGDELNGVLVAQQIAREIGHEVVAGCIVVVPAINLSGILASSRDFIGSDPDASPANLNRFFPGKADGDAANRYLHKLWNHLLHGNADMVIDLHTQTRGATYPLYVFADFRIPAALEMARLMQPDVILNDPGDAGVLETVWNENGVPCITVEVGTGKVTQPQYIARAVEGVKRILIQHGVITGEKIEVCAAPIEGDTITSIRAMQGGLTLSRVEMLQKVEEGDLVAEQYDAFGQLVQQYRAPHAGTVLSYNSDALRDAGALVVRLIS
ncbi:succinylglutamate desuccinylase/aspartoacylase family protein [Vibrio sp. SCSIO 43136]|uniref:succinylglutamate desuccinylase/aspartoacylase family protein n=1 Tax=Vibrio sp. SCSIO 43136 TaxID=2819101 RepID=UPI0020751E98|nr:succinylglutamate desuccinylase/aspartoacylase family protein [Vibrio sp. SCSIO 43136]